MMQSRNYGNAGLPHCSRNFTIRRLLPVMLLVIIACGPGSGRLAAQTSEDDLKLAVGFYKQERWDDAATTFRRFLNAAPKHEKADFANLFLGLALINQGKYAEARPVLRYFVKTYPKSSNLPEAMFRVGESSYLLDDFSEAEKDLTAFLKAYPKEAQAEWALPYLADAQMRLNRPQDAAATFEQSLKQFPKGRMAEESKFGLARALEATDQSERAIALYRELAADADGRRAPQAQMNLGARQFEDGDYEEAATAYEAMAERFPKSELVPQARLNAGFAWYQAERYPQAVTAFAAARKNDEMAGTAAYWQGVSHYRQEQWPEAAAVLREAFAANQKTDLAADTLFHWADAEYQQTHYDEAGKLFLQLVEKWPKSKHADQSLYLAAESAQMSRQSKLAAELVQRFFREFPKSRLSPHARLLSGRILQASGEPDDLKAAAAEFRRVLAEVGEGPLAERARFQLVRVLEAREDHAGVIEASQPLLELIRETGAKSEYLEVLVVAGSSQLESNKPAIAQQLTTDYLGYAPKGPQAATALAVRAEAFLRQKQFEPATADMQKLAEADPRSELTLKAIHRLAEWAYDHMHWSWAGEAFTLLMDQGRDTPFHATGLSGLAWSKYQAGQAGPAAEQFAEFVKTYPDDPSRTPQAAFMVGQALEDADELAKAAAAYGEAFEKLAPAKPAPAKAELSGPAHYAYRSALWQARALTKLGEIEQAHAAYQKLVEKFPEAGTLDRLLDEWALMNYNAQRFEESDRIFKRLVTETPQSDLADNARLSLAESDYIAGRVDAAAREFAALSTTPSADAGVKERSLYQLVKILTEQQKWAEVSRNAATLLKKFPQSQHRFDMQFYLGEAQLNLGKAKEARETLLALQKQADDPLVGKQHWFPQMSILIAEAHFRLKDYAALEATVAQFREANPESAILYKLDEVLGRGFKAQAKFDQAREAFGRVIADPRGRRTSTAARSQFLIAETYMIAKDYKQAQKEYFKVYHLYRFPEWQAPALYQAAVCDEALEQWSRAVRVYEDLLKEFPESERAEKARPRLQLARQKASG